jgi:hypothetical protein
VHPNVATTRLIFELADPNSGPLRLSYLLDEFSVRMTEHPADKMFALIGLLSAHERSLVPELLPNYRVDVRCLYMDAAFQLLFQDQNLDAISTCQPNNHNIPNLPSWTPDWSFNYRDPSPTETVPKINVLRRDSNFRASSDSTANIRRSGTSLILSGFIFDELKTLAEPLTVIQARQFNTANTILQVYSNPNNPWRNMWLAFRERAIQGRAEAQWRILFDKYKRRTWLSTAAPEEAYWLCITALGPRRLWQSRRIVANEPHVARTYADFKFLSTPVRLCVRLRLGLTILVIWEWLIMLVPPVRRFLGKSKWTSIDLPLHTIGRRMGWTRSGLFAKLPEHA